MGFQEAHIARPFSHLSEGGSDAALFHYANCDRTHGNQRVAVPFYLRPATMPEFTRSTKLNKDQVKGAAKEVSGSVKETAGKVSGSKETEAKGKIEKAEGKVQKTYGDAKENVKR